MDNDLPVWFPSRGIYFSKIQLQRFIFPELNDLRFGDYPPEPDEYITYVRGGWIEMKRSGYEKSGRKLTNHNAPFIAAAEIAAEIDARLNMISLPQRYWVTENFTDGMEFWEIAKFYHVGEDQVRREIGRMIRYMVGWKRPLVDYETWVKERRKYKTTVSV